MTIEDAAGAATSLTISRGDIAIVLGWFTVVGGALVKWLMAKSDKATEALTESVKNQTAFMQGWDAHRSEIRDGIDDVKQLAEDIRKRLAQ